MAEFILALSLNTVNYSTSKFGKKVLLLNGKVSEKNLREKPLKITAV